MYTQPVYRVGERMSPGGLRGLQIRRGALVVSSVGSTPMRSRHYFAYYQIWQQSVRTAAENRSMTSTRQLSQRPKIKPAISLTAGSFLQTLFE